MRIFIFILFLLISPPNLARQKLPSNQPNTDKSDSARIEILLGLCSSNIHRSHTRSVSFAEQALELSSEEGYESGKARALQALATAHWAHGWYEESIKNHDLAMPLLEQLKLTKPLAEGYNKIALLHYYQSNYQKAIDLVTKSIEMYTVMDDSLNLSRIHNNLGMIYDTKGEYLKSQEHIINGMRYKLSFENLSDQMNRRSNAGLIHADPFLNQKLLEEKKREVRSAILKGDQFLEAEKRFSIGKIYKTLNEDQKAHDEFQIASQLYFELEEWLLAGDSYLNLASSYFEQGDIDQAITLYGKSRQLYEKEQSYIRLANPIRKQAMAQKTLGNYRACLTYNFEGLELADRLGHRLEYARIALEISSVYQLKGDIKAALTYAKSSYDTGHQIGVKPTIDESAFALYSLHKGLAETEISLAYLEEHNQLSKELYDNRSSKNISELEAKYNNDVRLQEIQILVNTKELQEAKLDQRNFLMMAMGLGLILGVLLSLMIYRRNETLKKQQHVIEDQNKKLVLANKQKEDLVGEIHHRVKNNLQVISSLLNLQSRQLKDKKAKTAVIESRNRVQAMGLIHQRLYQNEQFSSILMDEYVKQLIRNVADSYGFDQLDFQVDLKVEAVKIDVDSAIVVGLIVNELVSNSLKHAFEGIDNPKLSVSFHVESEHDAHLTIADNGLGFPKGFDILKLESFGMKLVATLLKRLKGELNVWNRNGAVMEIAFTNFNTLS